MYKAPSFATLCTLACTLTGAQAEVSFEPWSYTETSLFPSAIIATATVDWNGDEQNAEDKKKEGDEKLAKDAEVATYGDENGWLAASLSEVPAKSKVSVEMSIEGYLKPSKWEGVVTKTRENVHIFPKAIWDYEALRQNREEKPVNLVIKVTVDGKALPEQTETCSLKSVNECPFYVLWPTEEEDAPEIEDFSFMFAAYVNENHPWIDGVLKDALALGIVDSFTGYQSEDPQEVENQVFAIWHALQRRGIKYSDISTSTPNKLVVSQHVRFLEDSIEAEQANCVDGSVLMASILQKIGLDTHLVMVPGHCFLAYADGQGDEAQLIGLETTMLGNDKLKKGDVSKLPEKLRAKEFSASAQTFLGAIAAGQENMEKHAEDFDSGEDPAIQIISIAEAREVGIRPIASGKAKK
jgi:hypothetical protein